MSTVYVHSLRVYASKPAHRVANRRQPSPERPWGALQRRMKRTPAGTSERLRSSEARRLLLRCRQANIGTMFDDSFIMNIVSVNSTHTWRSA
jgi:hypothetical protein